MGRKTKRTFTFKPKESPSVINDRSLRAKGAKCRAKYDSLKWDGFNTTFRTFKRAIEGHLLQVGAGYMTHYAFLIAYEMDKDEYLKSNEFWNMYKISPAQALYDKQYLFVILVTATMKLQHKTIFKYENSLDGILAWQELKTDYEYDGSRELKLEQLEALIQVPYSNSDVGGIATYIDKFQATYAELAAIAPADYTDHKMKRQLLMNVRSASGVSHLITKCQDSWQMGFDQCASYLRKNAIMIDHANTVKQPARLMLVEDASHEKAANPNPPKTIEQVSRMFYTMAEEHGLVNTYRMYQTRQFRETLSIPSAIWAELEPAIQEKINKIRSEIKKSKKHKVLIRTTGITHRVPITIIKEKLLQRITKYQTSIQPKRINKQ